MQIKNLFSMKQLFAIISIITTNLLMSHYAYASSGYIDINGGVNTSASSIAFGADAGYLFNRNFAAEAGFTDSPTSNNSTGSSSSSNNYLLIDGAAKGILPVNDIFSLFAKGGLGFYNSSSGSSSSSSSSSSSNVGLLLGMGAEFHVNDDWSIHLEDYTVTGSNPNFFMFGGQYRF